MNTLIAAFFEGPYGESFLLMSPHALLMVWALALILISPFASRAHRHWVTLLALLGLSFTLATVIVQLRSIDAFHEVFRIGDADVLLGVDPFSLFFDLLFLIAAILIVLLSLPVLHQEDYPAGEFCALVLLSTLGMMLMASSTDFLSIYVSLEFVAIASYPLVGYFKRDQRSNEAALKYFVIGAFSSALFIYGISLLFAASGTTNLYRLQEQLEHPDLFLFLGMLFILVGLGFKIAAVPFHMWAPDAYEGAPVPIAAFISVASKAAGIAVALRVFIIGLPLLMDHWQILLAFISAASMTVGNVTAIYQTSIKRLLAFSSIAHIGYILMGVVAADTIGLRAVLFYLFVYTFMNIGSFGLIVMLRKQDLAGESVEDFAGLSQRSPFAAFSMLVFLLSLAGIPITGGFVAKLLVFGATLLAGFAWLAVVGVLNTVISLYYYFRIVVCMYMKQPRPDVQAHASVSFIAAISLSLFFTILTGVYWEGILQLAERAAR